MKNKKGFIISGGLFAAFLIYTMLIATVDTAAIGPENSVVGFSKMNGAFYNLTGTNMVLYVISEVLGYMALLLVPCFGALGLMQMIKRKSFTKIDPDLIILCITYVVVFAFYILFEKVAINYRPVILDEGLEASYPSSHTLLSFCVLGTAVFQIAGRVKKKKIRKIAQVVAVSLGALIVVTRTFAGVHWLSDIFGSIILGTAIVCLYVAAVTEFKRKKA